MCINETILILADCLSVALNRDIRSLVPLKLIIMYLMHTIAILSCQTYITQAVNMHKIISYIDLNAIQNMSHISLSKIFLIYVTSLLWH